MSGPTERADVAIFGAGPAGYVAALCEARVRRALAAAQKYSLVANSVKSEIAIEPEIVVEERGDDGEKP